MALYKRREFIPLIENSAFDQVHQPGVSAPILGSTATWLWG